MVAHRTVPSTCSSAPRLRACHTCSQCLSFIPRLQARDRTGRCCLNLSSLYFVLSANRLGPARSGKLLLSLYIVLHILPISSVILSAFNFWRNPECSNIKRTEWAIQGGLYLPSGNHSGFVYLISLQSPHLQFCFGAGFQRFSLQNCYFTTTRQPFQPLPN